MRTLAILIALPFIFMGSVLMVPTPRTQDELVNGYLSTSQFSSSNVAYSQYLNQYKEASKQQVDKQYASSVRDHIATLAIDLCERFGNGGSLKYSPKTDRKAGQFRYSLSMVGGNRIGYGSMEAMREQLRSMSNDPNAVGYISCCGFALFCWETYLMGDPFYGTICEIAIQQHFQNIIKGDGTTEYIKQNAKPGDLLFYANLTSDVTQPPPKATGEPGKRYTHVEIYLGPYTGTNANGESYTHEYACVGSNEPSVNRDACIKSLDSTVTPGSSSHRAVYLVSIEDWIQSGYMPADPNVQFDPIQYAIDCPP